MSDSAVEITFQTISGQERMIELTPVHGEDNTWRKQTYYRPDDAAVWKRFDRKQLVDNVSVARRHGGVL